VKRSVILARQLRHPRRKRRTRGPLKRQTEITQEADQKRYFLGAGTTAKKNVENYLQGARVCGRWKYLLGGGSKNTERGGKNKNVIQSIGDNERNIRSSRIQGLKKKQKGGTIEEAPTGGTKQRGITSQDEREFLAERGGLQLTI